LSRWAVVGAIVIVIVVVVAVIAITSPKEEKIVTNEERLASIPSTAVKMTPSNDSFKPIMHSPLWSQPVPMPGPVNTAGAEDSPFMTTNGTWFFFFFTPDMNIPVQKQLIDGITGIWWTRLVNGTWTAPEKIILNDEDSLEGAECVVGTKMWFGSVRAGNIGEIDVYSADYRNGKWGDVENLGEQLNSEMDIGEFHLTDDMSTLYFHTGVIPAGQSMDLWVSHKTGSSWGTPSPLAELNTATAAEGFPYLTPDGKELWFTSNQSGLGGTGSSIFRSVKQLNGSWGAPEEIISNFAGECTMDPAGNIYFVHHYFNQAEGVIYEADIYVAYRL
jgi:hypothetical protein